MTRSQISGCRDLGLSGSWLLGLSVPGLVALAFNCVSHQEQLNTGARQGAMAMVLYLVLGWVARPCTTLGTPPCTTPGTPPRPPVLPVYPDSEENGAMGSKRGVRNSQKHH